MRKNYYLISGGLLLLASLLYLNINTKTYSKFKEGTPISSSEIIQQHINKKIALREKGYAKPDKPDKYDEYYRSLVSGYGKDAYGENHKLNALKSAYAQKASLKSATATLPWVQRGPGNIGGRTRCIIVDTKDASSQTWFAGAVSGGIWKTVDGGDSWEIVSPDLPNLATVCLTMAKSNTNIIYAGTGEGFYNVDAVRGDGIFKSNDNGASWTQLESTKGNSDFYYVNGIVVSHSNENILWAATNKGVFKSMDGGITWGDSQISVVNRYQRILIHPTNENILWVASNNQGIYKTENGGKNWLLVNSMKDAERIEIIISTKNPDFLYAIDVNSKMYYSRDGGEEWGGLEESADATTFLGGQGWYNSVLAVDPTNENKGFIGGIDLYSFEIGNETASTGTQSFEISNNISGLINFDFFGGNYESGNVKILSGYDNVLDEVQVQFGKDKIQKAHQLKNKTEASPFSKLFDEDLGKLKYVNFVDVPFKVMNVTTNKQLYASFIDGNNNGKFDLYKDGYEVIIVHSIEYESLKPNVNIVNNDGIYKLMAAFFPQLAAGALWDDANLPEGNVSFKSYVLKDRKLIAKNISDWRAAETSSKYSHADHHNITIVEGNEDNYSMIVGNDGGIGFSSNKGVSWKSKANGYITSQFYGITRHPKQYKYFGGLQDNGSALSGINPNKMSDWGSALGGDGFDVVWHPHYPNMMIGTYYFNQLQKSIDNGLNWANIGALIGDSGEKGDIAPFVTRIASCVANPDLLFVGGNSGLWKSTNFGDSWKNINMGSHWGYNAGSSPKIAISEANPDIVWAGIRMNSDNTYDTGRLHVSTDGGESFNALNVLTNMGSITNILAHPTEPETAYMLFSFSGYPKIFRTEDLGQNWEDLSGFGLNGSYFSNNGFPDVLVNTLIVMPFNTDEIWAGTEIGLFISKNNGVSWYYADNGIPAVSIWDIKIVGDEVILGTHGLGVWTVKMDELNNDIKNPYITKAGINPKGNFIINTTFDSQLDSVELYNDKGWVKTHYNIETGDRIDTISGGEQVTEQLYMYGYLSGLKYSSNRVNIQVTSINAPLRNYMNNFNDVESMSHFDGTKFSLDIGALGNNAIHSPHPYPENSDLYLTLKYPIIVSENSDLAFIKYYDIAFLEEGEVGSVYPEQAFYDYMVVEATKDGINWEALSLGYDFSYNSAWSNEENVYTNTPSAKDYVDHFINLYDKFEAEDTILIRFKLHSDPYSVGWGWALDSLRIQENSSNVQDNIKTEFDVNVYPNPVINNNLTVHFDDIYVGAFDVELYDSSGKEVFKQSYLKNTHRFEQQVNFHQIPMGIYLMKVSMGKLMVTKKICIK